MAQYLDELDRTFHALSDPTRRAVLVRLGHGPATISELATPFDMTLPSFMKHIHLLEDSGWIRTKKLGRVRTCTIRSERFAEIEGWLGEQRAVWEARTDRLETFIATTTTKGHANVDTV